MKCLSTDPMRTDTLKLWFTYGITFFILGGGFYALVIYEYQLDDLVKGAFLGFMGAAIAFVYGDQAATRTAVQQQKAYDAGVQTMPTVTANGEPPSVTVTPNGPVEGG